MRKAIRLVSILVALVALGFGGRQVFLKVQAQRKSGGKPPREAVPVPVEVAQVQRGRIRDLRVFSGTLEPQTRVVVSSKISGRVERLLLDMADSVQRGQLVAELDDDAFVQALTQAEADLAVARANQGRAESELVIATRELQRVQALSEGGMESEAQLDVARSEHLTRQAGVKVASAQTARAQSSVETARIKLAETKVRATWSGSSQASWVVSERWVQQGDTVSANTPLVAIVELDPITAVLYVTERDYRLLVANQEVKLTTEAYPGETFAGRVTRISPVFRQTSRQARVEIEVENSQRRLKPGMFVRSEVVLREVAEATLVPEAALLKRAGELGLFVLDPSGRRATWHLVTRGISEGGRVQVTGKGVQGRVVTLGQRLIDEGSELTIPTRGGQAPPSLSPASPDPAATAPLSSTGETQ